MWNLPCRLLTLGSWHCCLQQQTGIVHTALRAAESVSSCVQQSLLSRSYGTVPEGGNTLIARVNGLWCHASCSSFRGELLCNSVHPQTHTATLDDPCRHGNTTVTQVQACVRRSCTCWCKMSLTLCGSQHIDTCSVLQHLGWQGVPSRPTNLLPLRATCRGGGHPCPFCYTGAWKYELKSMAVLLSV